MEPSLAEETVEELTSMTIEHRPSEGAIEFDKTSS
jgi:hypothetical protein